MFNTLSPVVDDNSGFSSHEIIKKNLHEIQFYIMNETVFLLFQFNPSASEEYQIVPFMHLKQTSRRNEKL